MAQIDADLLERYQMDLQKNPRSKVFAPLAEAYRKMGLVDQALDICEQGVKYHPDFVSGRVACGRLHMEKENWQGAEEHLRRATELSPDNLLAHRLLARTLLQNRQPEKALKSFKYVLLLHPKDEEAGRFVQRWESMSAKDYEELYESDSDLFRSGETQELKNVLSIADAFLVRKEWSQARTWLTGQTLWKDHPQVQKRLALVPSQGQEPDSRAQSVERKVRYLRKLLQRIEISPP